MQSNRANETVSRLGRKFALPQDPRSRDGTLQRLLHAVYRCYHDVWSPLLPDMEQPDIYKLTEAMRSQGSLDELPATGLEAMLEALENCWDRYLDLHLRIQVATVKHHGNTAKLRSWFAKEYVSWPRKSIEERAAIWLAKEWRKKQIQQAAITEP